MERRHPREWLDHAAIEALFDATPDNVILIDTGGRIRAVNPSTCATFGYAERELVGNNVSMLMNDIDAARHDGYLAHYGRTGEAKIIGIGRQVIGKRRDGSAVPLLLSIGEFCSGEETLFAGIAHDITEQHRSTEQLAYLAQHDTLTGCLNRFGFAERLASFRANEPDSHFKLLVIDVDGFKAINDQHGHVIGDDVLQTAVDRIQSLIDENDVFARTGGDEFVVITKVAGPEDQTVTLAEDIVEALAKPMYSRGLDLRLSASIGISFYPEQASDLDDLLVNADVAMYEAKRKGGNRVERFSTTLKEQADEVYYLASGLREAVEMQQLEVHYQPQFDLQTLRPVAIEALVRWNHPERGMLSPDAFLKVADDSGLLPTIDQFVLERAVADAAMLADNDIARLTVAVNTNPTRFAEPRFLSDIRRVLDEAGLDPALLELELVEHERLSGSAQVTANLAGLNELGVGLALDDFGTGYSSLAQLRGQHYSNLKIDRSFVQVLPGEDADASLVASMLKIGQIMAIDTIAEGIETLVQRNMLLSMGCRFGQGYWYAKPMPFTELVDWLTSRAYERLISLV